MTCAGLSDDAFFVIAEAESLNGGLRNLIGSAESVIGKAESLIGKAESLIAETVPFSRTGMAGTTHARLRDGRPTGR
jgi:hypothetical protein